MKSKVTAEEKVTVATGTFDAWKLVVTSEADGNQKMYFWIDKATRRFLKTSAVIAEMGGAQMTGELQP